MQSNFRRRCDDTRMDFCDTDQSAQRLALRPARTKLE